MLDITDIPQVDLGSPGPAADLLGEQLRALMDLANAPAATAGIVTMIAVDGGGNVVQTYATQQTAKGEDAKGDGATADDLSFAALLASSRELFIDNGTFKINSEINVTEQDYHIVVDPRATFTNAALDMGPIVKVIGANPVLAFDGFYKDVTADYDIYEHVVGRSVFLKADTAGAVCVALYANTEVAVAGASGFGANFGAYVTGAGTGVAVEIDSHVTNASGIATALALDSIGSYPSVQAIIVQPNGPNSPFNYGLNLNNASGHNAIVHEAIRFTGAGSAERFLYAGTDMLFTAAEIELPSFIVGPSVAEVGTNGKIRIDANASGSPLISAVGSAAAVAIRYRTKSTADHIFQGGDGLARLVVKGTVGASYMQVTAGSGGFTIQAAGTDTDAQVVLTGKGIGGGSMLDGAGHTLFAYGNNQIAFFGATKVSKQTAAAVLSTGGSETNVNICTAINQLNTIVKNLGLAA